MERYETASIEVATITEDVITASGSNQTTTEDFECYVSGADVWIIEYVNGDWVNTHSEEKPDICP